MARNHDSKALLAGSRSVWACTTAEEVEARALFWAMSVSLELG